MGFKLKVWNFNLGSDNNKFDEQKLIYYNSGIYLILNSL